MANSNLSNDLTSFKRRISDTTQSTQGSLEACKQTEVEGGKHAWLTVAGSFLVYYASFGIVNSFGFFQDYYQQGLLKSTPPATIALVGTVQIALMNCLATVSGAICDMYGVKWLYIGSSIGTSGGLLALSFAQDGAFWQVFLSQGLLMGTAIGFGCQPALAVAGQHFRQRRALAMGIVSAGCGAGGVCFPIMLGKLVVAVGFTWTLRLAALKVMVCYGLAIGLSTSKHTAQAVSSKWRTLLDFQGFRDRRYAVLCAGAWLVQLGLFAPTYYIQSYCASIYPTTNLKAYLVALINAAGILGGILGGFAGDTFGRLNILYPSALILGTLCLTLWLFEQSLQVLIIFVCLYGFFGGVWGALLPPVISQISPNEHMGARIGAFYSIIAVASLIGSPIGASLMGEKNKEGYRWLIVFGGGVMALGSVVLFVGRVLHGSDLRARW
ncbi:major facilitator superfamily domain-containing protein [Lophiotrema nucula]|uniref:Major facilitator superfamily domain-containing protein n=1 Tax=Lophiotrema nucula TaxID=690887 RepID=A0A6A5YTJ0_9PLEO|nr:major facilitator superfamily domain-containing protein [Lophiotrema nucula]